MNQGGTPAAMNEPIIDPARRADDVVGAAGVPAGLVRDRVQRAGVPRTTQHARRRPIPTRPSYPAGYPPGAWRIHPANRVFGRWDDRHLVGRSAVAGVARGRVLHDPAGSDGTLDRVSGGTMRVGVTHADPWVLLRDGQPVGGAEVELVRRFARSIGARVQWIDGSEEELVNSLKEGSLDMVIAGLTSKSRWKKDAAFTRPYLPDDRRGGRPAGRDGRPQAPGLAGVGRARQRGGGARREQDQGLRGAGRDARGRRGAGGRLGLRDRRPRLRAHRQAAQEGQARDGGGARRERAASSSSSASCSAASPRSARS